MRCREIHCALNEELLALLPRLDGAQQHAALRAWASASLAERAEIVAALRPVLDDIEPDFMALSKIAAFLDCSVLDLKDYLHDRSASPPDDT